jgi:hypothetical protein
MRRVVADATPEEMAEMEDWSFSLLEALNANQQMDMLKLFGPKYDIDPENITQMFDLPGFFGPKIPRRRPASGSLLKFSERTQPA